MKNEETVPALFHNSIPMAWLLMVATTAAAAVLDVKKFTVPNWLTLPLCLLGMIYHTALSGYAGLAFSVTGLVVGFLLLLVFFVIGAMGAGDVKLLAGVGAWLGPVNTIWICLVACIAAGFYSLGVYAMQGRFGRLMTPFRAILARCRSPRRPATAALPVDVVARHKDRRWRVLPFALMIAIGVLLVAIGEYGVSF